MQTQDELRAMEVKELEELYSQNLARLNADLLNGVEWAELSVLRGFLTEIGVAIDVKLAADGVRKNSVG
ncbi:MAG: hypothetical protein EOO11_08095 [Chitinophagaceae bacterium]|nr:MAG: hypothetical protein EOO11_08095 [Chitinophagaceae bacterium]